MHQPRGDQVNRSLADALQWMQAGAGIFDEAVGALSTADLRQPSGLPGWSRGHVWAHVIGNARALGNLAHWAATGAVRPMYDSLAQRDAEIEAGAALPAHQLAARHRDATEALNSALGALVPEQWERQVVTAHGRAVPATEVPWMRAREVCVHAVDLRTGITFDDLPLDFLAALAADVSNKRGSVPVVDGPLPQRVAWLAGRDHALVDAPQLPSWL
jgi:maleylpyruvate isomerase